MLICFLLYVFHVETSRQIAAKKAGTALTSKSPPFYRNAVVASRTDRTARNANTQPTTPDNSLTAPRGPETPHCFGLVEQKDRRRQTP